jgi:hypothetical protein
MPEALQELIKFRADKLFNGAVNIDWFASNEERASAASEAYVFHGPQYHGVSQADIGVEHGHRLVDTATFALSIVRRSYGMEDQPFTLAIAGYGTGKSHLALSVASLLADPDSEVARAVLSAIEAADRVIGAEIRAILHEANKPCLVVALNGMKSFDLTTELTRQIIRQLKRRSIETRALDELRPRFSQAATLIRMGNDEIRQEVLGACAANGIEEVLAALDLQDELIYGYVHRVFSTRGMALTALRGESVHDIIDLTVREFCGPSKPFQSLVILFDEFGKYTEFATVRSQIAGSGALQDLFEGIQSNNSRVCLSGFIQFELNAYVQRVAVEYRNEILRYVTRYQSASRVYLSINLETLIANLLEKRQPEAILSRFSRPESKRESETIIHSLSRWFPQSHHHRLWSDLDDFHTIIRTGCWPLTPYSTWFLFYLAAGGKHLQERSALALLGQSIERHSEALVPDAAKWGLSPVDLWSDALQQELLTAEEGGQQGAITHAYASVEAKHGSSISSEQRRLLRGVVLASKMGLQVRDRADAVDALSELTGVYQGSTRDGLRLLQEEYNVIEWDEAFKQFDILGDAVPRTQFLSFLRQRAASSYDDRGKAALFAAKAATFCELLSDLECDFAEENKITTREWRYQAVTSSLETLPMYVKLASTNWEHAVGVDEPRGTVVYCYVEPGQELPAVEADIVRFLRAAAKEKAVSALPLLVVLLHDEEGALGQALTELVILNESLTDEDRVRFGNLIPAHTEKQKTLVRTQVDAMIKRRNYVTGLREKLESQRLSRVATELFSRIYLNPLTFPFDGFSTAKGNAADSCQELTRELLLGTLDYDAVMGKPVKVKNRAVTVLKESWGIFAQNGDVMRRPSNKIVRSVVTKWDDMLSTSERRLPVEQALRQICNAPFGANIASASLLLGVFVAPRAERLLVSDGTRQFGVAQWLQDGLFRGKYVDFSSLSNIDLVMMGEESSEWETLLDEWEQSASYSARIECLQRASELKKRVPVPPSLAYREVHLQGLAREAMTAISAMEGSQEEALQKMEAGREKSNISLLAWGAAALFEVIDQMEDAEPLWDDQEIDKLRPLVERAKQEITQSFHSWLVSQTPRTDTPEAVGDFKHKMLRLLEGNLKKLGLDSLVVDLEKHVAQAIRNAETAAESRQLIRGVRSWMFSNQTAGRISRVADGRSLLDVGKEFTSKLQGMAQRIQSQEIGDLRTQLSQFLAQIKDGVDQLVKRAQRLWNMHIKSVEDLDNCLQEIESLVAAFEYCPNDLTDLHMMRKAVRTYQEDRRQLADERLTWPDFESLAERLKAEAAQVIKDDDVPWSPADAIDGFVECIAKARKQTSTEWIDRIELEVGAIESMSAIEANRLDTKIGAPPAVLTESHEKRRASAAKLIRRRLDSLKIEWLVEKFKELSPELRNKFLKLVVNTEAEAK